MLALYCSKMCAAMHNLRIVHTLPFITGLDNINIGTVVHVVFQPKRIFCISTLTSS